MTFALFLVVVIGLCVHVRSGLVPAVPQGLIRPKKMAIVGEKEGVATSVANSTLAWIPNSVKNGMASGMAAAVVKTILQPFDTIKTMMQAQRGRITPIMAFRDVVQTRGLTGLWSGLGITIVGSAPSVAIYFGCYSSFKQHIGQALPQPEYKLVVVALSAMCGNTIASVFRVPYEVIKQRMQYGLHRSAFEAIRHSFKHEGAFGLFADGKLASQIIRDVPYAMVTLVSYEVLQTFFARRAREHSAKGLSSDWESDGPDTSGKGESQARPMTDAVCGACAGGIGTICTTPMDVIKTRMMTTKQFMSVPEAAIRIFREEGARTFLVGVYPRLMHKIPANGLFFVCYELFRQMFGVAAEMR